jgi:hypothetical protein
LVAVALLGAITHQTLAAWGSADARPGSFIGRFRSIPSASFANAVVVLYAVSTLLGGIIYLYFRVDVRPELERAGHWHVLGFFDLKEHFAAIGLALLPAYWVCWRRPLANEPAQTRTALTSILAFIIWWGFLSGHVANNIMGFGIVLAGTHHSRDVADPAMGFLAPAMYWYGWAATAALGALIVALVAASLAECLARYVWPGWVWVIPVLSMIACVYLTLPWFRL